ncbi:hypothetical protein [Azotobacter beijerinckii]|uniref:hypothetical protein n=1 Tax=Azotobacter beijerinckii TaxID=170623 RepID=UPI0011139A70|nr:hypothetical protein [Azotobacter beijerinckii]
MAEQIITAKAGYVLALKDNHPTLPRKLHPGSTSRPILETIDKGHDRLAVCRYSLSGQFD